MISTIRERQAAEKQQKRKAYLESLENEGKQRLVPLEEQRNLFTENKAAYNRYVTVGREREDDAVGFLREARRYYTILLTLYQELLAENTEKATTLVQELSESKQLYKSAKRNLVALETELEKQQAKAEEIAKAWLLLVDKKAPQRAKKLGPLTENEMGYLDEQATQYRLLYEEARANSNEIAQLSTQRKEYARHRASAKAEKSILTKAIADHKAYDRTVRKRLNEFKRRNKLFEPVEVIVIDEKEEEEEEEEEEGILSETGESDTREARINDIREKLLSGNYTALSDEFREPYQQLFLDNLFCMYRLKNTYAITASSLEYIKYLLDERSIVIERLYTLLEQKESTTAILEYLRSVSPPLTLPNIEERVERLIEYAERVTRTAVLKEIYAFLYNVQEEEREPEEEPLSTAAEDLKTQVLFAAYRSIRPLNGEECLYIATENSSNERVSLSIQSYKKETDELYEALATTVGFARLREFFRLEQLPQFARCPTREAPLSVYIHEYPEYGFEEVTSQLDNQEKFCFFVELLVALRAAKQAYGIQHNDLSERTIRFTRRRNGDTTYTLDGVGFVCSAPYTLRLTGLSMASMQPKMTEEQRSVLANDDLNSFYNLVMHQQLFISDAVCDSLPTVQAIPFDVLLRTLRTAIDQ